MLVWILSLGLLLPRPPPGASGPRRAGAGCCSADPDPPVDSALRRLQGIGDEVVVTADTCAPRRPAGEALPRRNVLLAAGAPLSAIALYLTQRANPPDGLQLLRLMERDSPPLLEALMSGTPTVIDFYAENCEACMASAAYMRKLESSFGDRVNFVTLDGNDPANAGLVARFGVDGVPHLAFISAERKLEATLIGFVPEPIMRKQIDALASAAPLPYGQSTAASAASSAT